jgi:3'-phosphoadenosine 5'-phosphosulfate sulfotransferase (PAPS reductase)/FAD synthetase
MLRNNSPTAAVHFQTPNGWEKRGGTSKSLGTRQKFPQQSANLATRWCSSYLKIAVCDVAIAHQNRFIGKRTLFVSGERAEESAARAKYAVFEPHRKHSKSRHIDHWRPVLHWSTQEVWQLIERHKIVAHPAYHLGFGRTSCRGCIFICDEDWRTNLDMGDEFVNNIAHYEDQFGVTIARPNYRGAQNVLQRALCVQSRPLAPFWRERANNNWGDIPIKSEKWQLPIGAYASLKGGSP